MPDDDGYPTEEELDRIRKWDPADGQGLIDFVRSIWWNPEWGCSFETENGIEHHHISTGGWSGNEEVIGAMQDNFLWWGSHWHQHRRGGHYEFQVKAPDDDPHLLDK